MGAIFPGSAFQKNGQYPLNHHEQAIHQILTFTIELASFSKSGFKRLTCVFRAGIRSRGVSVNSTEVYRVRNN